MCDVGSFDGGMAGGASFPMNNLGNTMGIGDVIPAGSKGQYGSGDIMWGGFTGTGGKKKKQKKSVMNTVAQKKPAFTPFGFGSMTNGGYDMSPRPLFVPHTSNK